MPIDASTLTSQEQITAVYVAYYDRAPDPAGLQFWVDQLEGGRPIEQIATDFSSAAETIQKYPFFDAPELASSDVFITSIYVNLFGRAPDAAGLDFWADQLESGSTPVGEIILAIFEGAQDSPDGDDLSTALNKIEVGIDWAIAAANVGIGTNSNLIAEDVDGQLVIYDQDAFESATTILDGVTGDTAAVAAAKADTVAFFEGAANEGDTFVLTTGLDNVQGTSENDSIVGVFEDTTSKTFTLGDTIDGKGGVDTLIVVNDSDSNLSFSGKTITSVENLIIQNAATGFDEVNIANTAFETVTIDMGAADNNTLDVNNINAASAVTLTNFDADFDHYIDLNFATSSATTAVTNITVSDTDFNELYLDINANFTAATDYTFNLTATDVNANDNFNVNANITLNAADITMEVNVVLDNVSMETDGNWYLDFNTNGVEMATINVSMTDTDINQFEIDIDDNSNGTGTMDVANITLTDVYVDDNFDIDHVETINMEINGDVFIDDMEFYDYEGDVTLDIVANGNLVIDGDLNMNDNAFNQTVVISGAGNVDLGELDLVNDANTMQIVDASSATGNITVDDSNNALDEFTGGTGNDSLKLGWIGTVANMGLGDDLVDTRGYDYGDANAGTLDGGDGIDTIAIDSGAELDAATAANISNFEVLDFSNGTGTYDMSVEASLDDIRANGSIAAPVTISEFEAANSLTLTDFVDADAITVTLATDTASDATTVNIVAEDTSENNIADGETDAVLVMEEFETITVNSTGVNTIGDVDGDDVAFVGADYANVVDLNASDMTKLNVTGDAQTTITFTGAEALREINAAANTGGVTIDASAGAIVAGISFAGTDADDTFTATANGDIVQANGGADSITLGGGEDVARYISQSDSVLTLTDTNDDGIADAAEGWDVIGSFSTGDDIIELSSLLGLETGDARSAVLQKGALDGTLAGLESFIGDGADFFSNGLVDRAVAFSTDGADGLVFVDANGDGNFTQADDMVIELTGITSFTVADVEFG